MVQYIKQSEKNSYFFDNEDPKDMLKDLDLILTIFLLLAAATRRSWFCGLSGYIIFIIYFLCLTKNNLVESMFI
jgi:hypothetical protein